MENNTITESRQESVNVEFSIRCHVHGRYTGMRAPRTQCAQCWHIYNERQKSGVVERRIRVRGRGVNQTQELSNESVCSYVDNICDAKTDDQPENSFKDVAKRLYLKNRSNLLGY